MAETLENGVMDMVPESAEGGATIKQQIHQENVQKHNGLKNHQQDQESNDCTEDMETSKESSLKEEDSGENVNEDKHESGENIDAPNQSEIKIDNEVKTKLKPETDEDNDSNHHSVKSDNIAEKGEDTADSTSNDEQSRGASEPMEVDESSNIVDESSNVSVASNSDVKQGNDESQNPSIVSEDSSRDSVDTIDSKSDDMDDSSLRDGLVSKVKDADGEDILITLNEDETGGDKDLEDSSEAEDIKKKNETQTDNKSEEKKSDATESNQENAENVKQDKEINNDQLKSDVNQPVDPKASLLANMQEPIPMGNAPQVASNLAITSGGHTFLIQPNASIPVGAQLIQQGPQLGYITKVGVQNVFVPVSNLTQAITQPQPTVQPAAPVPQQKPTPPTKPPILDIETLKPKSSMEMIELMKWEIQNRIPDNSNWSVAFHPKKEELSSITSFLLELGHDVVKEAVYKDIIQIQTKKKTAGELKENEIESLDKMKTVYENTRKKVVHLQLKNKKCNGCEFKTESATVMNWHKDFPHFEPPWDTAHGFLKCAHCNYKTKAAAQFSFHMSAMHKADAKLPDKISCFQCELCPLNTTTKNKLDKHRQKCMKHFKMNVNLHPYFHDVNFCMKTCYYKPKKSVLPKPVMPPKTQVQQPPTTTANTRRSTGPPGTAQPPRMASPMNPAVRPSTPTQGLPRPPPLQQMQPHPSKLQAKPATSFSHPRPSIATARSSVPPAPRTPTQQQRPIRPPGKEMSGFEVCELCGGYVKDRQALRIHFYYAHKVEMPQAIFNRPTRPLNCEVCQSKFWTTQGLTKHKTTLRHYTSPAQTTSAPSTGTNQQCFMCMRKVANLFIHIENVHGMTMKDLVALKKCIICGITAADRKNLELHMASAHGVLIKANEFLAAEKPSSKPVVPSSKPLVPIQQSNPPKPSPKPAPKPSSSTFAGGVPVGKNVKPSIKQNLCVFCQLQFADNIQLTMHCIKNHATCSGCGMVVQSNKHLSNHNCRQMKRHCDICGMRNISADMYVEHVKKLHMKPCKVKVSKMSQDEIFEVKDKIKREYKPQVISLDSEEDSDVEMVDSNSEDSNKSRTKSKTENKENEENSTNFGDDLEPVQQDLADKMEKVENSETDGIKNEAILDTENEISEGGDEKDARSESVKKEVIESDKECNDSSTRKRKISDSVSTEEDPDTKKVKLEDDLGIKTEPSLPYSQGNNEPDAETNIHLKDSKLENENGSVDASGEQMCV